MKLVSLIVILMIAMIANSPRTDAKEKYWKPKCEKGAKLEQRSGKQAFRCRREGSLVEEYRVGRCQRPLRLRRATRFGYNYGCLGTTIAKQGDAGTFESYTMFVCPPKYERVRQATSPGRTCVRSALGTAYEKPVF